MHDLDTLTTLFGDAVTITGGKLAVARAEALASPTMDELARAAVFGEGTAREYARWMLWELGQAVGVRPASIQELYMARGRGEVHGFTVPAINVRGSSYETARAIFRTAVAMKAGAFILEIARSEIAYTEQRPAEYVSVMLAAALREGFRGPLFIQGDHFQVNHKKYATNPQPEVDAVKALVREAVGAGFYNIDVDTSTLVDLSKGSLAEQQRLNYEVGIDILKEVRAAEPPGVTISVGGEIGEVGTQNSTVEELRAYMDGFGALLPKGTTGLSKISVQSGTSHGGVVLADGSIADVKLDLDTLETLSRVARDEYKLAGAVQHGASTLPDSAFHNFPKREVAEIHLATNFQNMLFDAIPAALRGEIYGWLSENAKDERKPTDTDEQFFYKTRKKALGPFKRKLWDLPDEVRAALGKTYDAKFRFLFEQLAIGNTAETVARHVKPPVHHRPMPADATPAHAAAPDDADLSDGMPAAAVGAMEQSGVEELWLATLQRALARASHDVKDALNGVSVNVEVIRSRAARPDVAAGAVAPFAEAAGQQLERLTILIEAVLALGRVDRNPVDVALTLRRLVTVCGASSSNADAAVELADLGSDATGATTTRVGGSAVRLAIAAPLLELVAGTDRAARASVVRCTVGGDDTSVLVTIGAEGRRATMPDRVGAAVHAAGVRWTEGPHDLSLAFPRA